MIISTEEKLWRFSNQTHPIHKRGPLPVPCTQRILGHVYLLNEYTSGWHLFSYLHPKFTIQSFLFLVEISFKNLTLLLLISYFFWIVKSGKWTPDWIANECHWASDTLPGVLAVYLDNSDVNKTHIQSIEQLNIIIFIQNETYKSKQFLPCYKNKK